MTPETERAMDRLLELVPVPWRKLARPLLLELIERIITDAAP